MTPKMRILVTAGPTREFIDPVRYISNSSTGFFGYQIAREALKRGHEVILISGPTSLRPPMKAKFVPVVSAADMQKAVWRFLAQSECLIMTAAVADYRPAARSSTKIKKTRPSFKLGLKRNPDILSEASKRKGRRVFVGFALETNGTLSSALSKMTRKKLDIIVATPVDKRHIPFGNRRIRAVILDRRGGVQDVDFSKEKLARIILDKAIAARYPLNRKRIL